MHSELRTAPAQPPMKPGARCGDPWDHHSSGALVIHPLLNETGRCLQLAPHPPQLPQQARPHAARDCRALSRIAALRPCRGNPLRSSVAPGSRLLTLPSILHPGFRSLSAPNNAALAKHLPQPDRAPAGRLAGATHSRNTFPAIVWRGSTMLRDKRQQQSLPQESQCSQPQYALRTTTSQPRLQEGGEQGGTLGMMALKGPTK